VRDTLRLADEAIAVGYAFEVAGDHASLVVMLQGAHDVQLIDVGLVADADQRAEPDVVGLGHVQDRRHQGPGLRDVPDPADGRQVTAEARVQMLARHHDAQAVRPDHADARPLGGLGYCLLECPASLADLLEPGCDDDDRAHAHVRTLLYDSRDHFRRNDD